MKNVVLKPETTSKIQELASINADSAGGFVKAAEVVENATLASLFRKFGRERASFAETLKTAIGPVAAEGTDTTSFSARIHRWWMELRGKLSGGDDYAILAEVERGEDHIKAAYKEVILETTGSPVNDILHVQLRSVKAAHDRILAMRDAAKA